MPATFKTLAEANEAFDAEQAAKLSAQGQAQKNFTDFQGAVAEKDSAITSRDTALLKLATAITERDGFKTQAETVAAEFKSHKESETVRVNAEAVRILAASGHQPVKVGVDTDPNAAKASKIDPKLTGLERAIAAHKLSQSTK